MAHIALIGASGNVGTRLLKELAARGHQITAIARDPGKIPAHPGVTAVRGDAADGAGLSTPSVTSSSAAPAACRSHRASA